MKKFKLFVLALLLFIVSVPFVNAEETAKSEVNVYVFRGEGCGFCKNALTFFEGIEEEYGKYFNLVTYEVWNDSKNAELMDEVAKYLKTEIDGVPFIIVGDETFPGFDEVYSKKITDEIVEQYNMPEAERTDLIKNMKAGIGVEKDDMVLETVILLVILAVILFVIFARRSNDEVVESIPRVKESNKDEEIDEEEIVVVEKKAAKKPENDKKEVSKKANNSTKNKKKTTNSKKRKNN